MEDGREEGGQKGKEKAEGELPFQIQNRKELIYWSWTLLRGVSGGVRWGGGVHRENGNSGLIENICAVRNDRGRRA